MVLICIVSAVPSILVRKEAWLGMSIRVEHLPGLCEVLCSDTTPT